MKWTAGKNNDSRVMEDISYELSDFPITSRRYFLSRGGEKEITWHWHPEIEIVYVAEGSIQCGVNNYSCCVQQGKCVFVNAKETHRIELADEKAQIISLAFPSAFLFGRNNRFYREYISTVAENDRYQYIFMGKEYKWEQQFIEEVYRIAECLDSDITGNMCEIIKRICSIWEILYMNKEQLLQTDPLQTVTISQVRIRQMLAFIQKNYSEPITLHDIADAAHISQSEAARCFKKHMDMGPVNYLIQYRLEAAKEKLQTSDLSVTDIAMQCGFESVSYFDRVFRKKYWLTPKEYRNSIDYLDDL